MAMKRFACMLLARAARSTKPRLGAVAVISSTVCSKPALTKACLISRASWRLKAYSGIPRALIAPGTPTVWPTSTTTRNEARAQLSEAAWLGFWMRCWARSPSTPAASSVIAITTPRYFVAARTPIIRLTSYRSSRNFPLLCSEIGYEVLILFAPWCRYGGIGCLFEELHAEGAQIYECKADSGGKVTWLFREPVATLLLNGNTIGRHYAGPTWELTDGSVVIGKTVSNAPGATAADIPWLKLDVVNRRGNGLLSKVATVQRINTHGGVAQGTCDQPGSFLSVPYSADYRFLSKED